MASTLPSSSSLPISNPKPFSRIPLRRNLHAPPHPHLTIPRATDSDGAAENEAEKPAGGDDFDSRLSQMRLRYKSGQGKKAEVRKTKKAAKGSSGGGASLYLPPVKLKQAVSEGVNVEFGFSLYSEKVNGRIAAVGLTALILVELATGQSVIKFHSPAIIFIQMYFMAAASALYIKYEKEKVSVWPPSISSQE